MLTTKQAAEQLGVDGRSVVKLISRGRLRAVKLGRDWLIEENEVERYKAERRPAHRPKKAAQ